MDTNWCNKESVWVWRERLYWWDGHRGRYLKEIDIALSMKIQFSMHCIV